MATLAACEIPNEEPKKMTNVNELLSVDNQVLAFYNVENLFDLENDPRTNDDDFTPSGEQHWTKDRYEHKLDNISDVLFKLGNQNPMVIGLVEIENYKVVKDLASTGNLSKTPYEIVQYDSEDRRGIDCALLYDSRRMNVIEQEKIQVRIPGSGDYVTRDILYVKGQIANHETLHIFVNHWSSRREGISETEPKRIRAATVLKEKIDEILVQDENAKIIVMGDFNDEPKNKSIQQILNAGGSKARLFNLMAELARDGQGSIVHQREWLLFDQIMISQNLKHKNGVHVKDEKAYVFKDESILYTYPNGGQKPNSTYGGPEYYGGYSDHLPVYLFLAQ